MNSSMMRRKFKMRVKEKYDFSGWATKNNLRCADGRTILRDAFIDDDGHTVPLVWQHQHNSPENVLGHALLENRDEGVYAYCKFNSSPYAQHAKELVKNGDIKSLSIYANGLKQQGGNVLHGAIREVSLVLAGANPGAMIDNPVLQHGDGSFDEIDYEATIYTGEDITINGDYISHGDEEMTKEKTIQDILNTFDEDQLNALYYLVGKAAEGTDSEEEVSHSADAEDDGQTLKDIVDSLNDEQKQVLYFLVGKAAEQGGVDEDEEDEDEEDEEDIEHSYEGGTDFMKYNVFEGGYQNDVISHADMEDIFANAKRCGSLKTAFESYADVIQHSVTDIDYLFPDYRKLMNDPTLLKRDDEWVNKVWNGVHKSPFSRVKTMYADITANEARAKGFIKGKQKLEEVLPILKRTTDPQTIYKLQKLSRDDVLDITDFNVVSWIKAEMRVMLNEELARAILIGDGRAAGDDKIDETHIRPVWLDNDFYTIHKDVTIPANATNYDKAEAIIEGALRARKDYKGSGTPVAFFDPDTLTTMLLAKDTTGRRIYNSMTDLAAALRVSAIHEVPVMENQIRTSSTDNKKHQLLGLFLNLSDYNVGADKGGEVNMFDDFDIDYNRYAYLIETRCSGALTRPYAAIAIETVVEG
jgi:hypothetical protein